jgi:lipopolysaccharide biosynthesis glycosyltransferase
MPLAVTLRSAMSNMSGDQAIELIILDGGIREPNKQRLRRTAQCRHRVDVSFVRPPAESLQGLPTTNKYPLAVYFRLLLPDLLPHTVKKVLYIDGDLVIEGDLSRLWQQDMGDRHALAVQDICHRYIERTNHLRRPEFQVPKDQKYYNSGVMLINLEKWRQDRIGEQALDYLRTYPESGARRQMGGTRSPVEPDPRDP